MKKNIFRILAFAIDMLLINIILVLLGYVSFINPKHKAVSDEIKVFNEVQAEYNKLSSRIDEMLYDNYLDYSESNEIKSSYPYFKDVINFLPVNSEIDSNLKSKTKSYIDNIYNNKYYSYTYSINEANLLVDIIGFFLSIFYFGLLEWLFHGKTLGKKIFKLKTVDNNNFKKEIPMWKFLVKSLFISEAVFLFFNIICICICHQGFDGVLNAKWYTKAYSLIYNFQYIYNVFLLLVMLVRNDSRCLHDLVLDTRIAMVDKKNREVKEEKNEEVNN